MDEKAFQAKAAELAEAHLDTLDKIAAESEEDSARIAAIKLLAELGGKGGEIVTSDRPKGHGILFIMQPVARESVVTQADPTTLELKTGV